MTFRHNPSYVRMIGDKAFSHMLRPHRYKVAEELLEAELLKRVRNRHGTKRSQS